jgi:tRNA1Val (adenine37-N6)-methyltransferase
MSEVLKPGERLDDLMRGQMRIIQNPGMFCFGTDAVLLADFARVRDGETVCDLGAGSGILPLLIAARARPRRIDAVEIQGELCGMMRRSIALNGLEDLIAVHEADMRDAPRLLGSGRYDCVVCNPPYYKAGANITGPNESVRIARHETTLTLAEILRCAAKLLRHGGRLCMIHQALRALDVADGLRAAGLAPKAVRAVHFTSGSDAKLALWEARKGGKEGLTWQKPLLLRDESGSETRDYKEIYGEIPIEDV